MKYKPLGARLLVDPIITTVSLEKRAELAGIEIVLEQDNVPKPTQGRVIALGSDPLLHEELKIGDIVFYNWHSGNDVVLEGKTFRQLEHQDVTGVMQEDDVKTSSAPEETLTESK